MLQDHDVYKKRLQADGTPIDEGIKHTIGPENIDLMSKENSDENGTVCGSCYGAQTPTQPCCNTCDEVIAVSLCKEGHHTVFCTDCDKFVRCLDALLQCEVRGCVKGCAQFDPACM